MKIGKSEYSVLYSIMLKKLNIYTQIKDNKISFNMAESNLFLLIFIFSWLRRLDNGMPNQQTEINLTGEKKNKEIPLGSAKNTDKYLVVFFFHKLKQSKRNRANSKKLHLGNICNTYLCRAENYIHMRKKAKQSKSNFYFGRN